MFEELMKKPMQKLPPLGFPGVDMDELKKKYNLTEIIRLHCNENQLGTSPKAVAAMVDTLTNMSFYPEFDGITLRKKLAGFYNKKYDMNFNEENFIVTYGASTILSLLGEVFLTEEDELLTTELTFGAYKMAATRSGAKFIAIPTKEDLQIDLEGMLNAITPKTKMIVICNPNNPTGLILPEDELKDFIAKVPKDVIVVMDEAYFELITVEGYESMIKVLDDYPNVVVVRTFSKVFGLAGVRVGYGIMNKEMFKTLMRASDFAASVPALAAALAALDDEEFVSKTVAAMKEGREYLAEEFDKLGFTVYPTQTNFIYIDTKLDTKIFADKLREKGILIRGDLPFSRISIGTMDQNKKLVDAVKEILKCGCVPAR